MIKKVSILLVLLIFLTSCKENVEVGLTDYGEKEEYDKRITELEDMIDELQEQIDEVQQHMDNKLITELDYVTQSELDSAILDVEIYHRRDSNSAHDEIWTAILDISRSLSDLYLNSLVEDNLDYESIGKLRVEEWLNEEAMPIVYVDNAKSLLQEIGSNKHIVLEEGFYNLSNEIECEINNSSYSWDEVYDGYQISIEGVENLIIEGAGSDKTEIVIEDAYADVLVFNNCRNIVIRNIKAGHQIEKGFCQGGVLEFQNTKNVWVDKSILYGCGMEGITTVNVNNLVCTDSTIEDCTYSIVNLSKTEDTYFENCILWNCVEFSMFFISDCKNIEFNNNFIASNYTNNNWTMIELSNCDGIRFDSNIFFNNHMSEFINTMDGVEFYNNTFDSDIYGVSE